MYRRQREISLSPRKGPLVTAVALVGLALGAPSASVGGVIPAGTLLATVAGQGSYGTVKGRLVWGGDQAPPPITLVAKGQASKDPAVCASTTPIASHALEVDPTSKGIKHGFAYLVRPSGTNPAAVADLVSKAATVEIDQINCDFVPYAVAVHQDQAILFKSSDPVNHNVHLTPFVNPPFNQILSANGSVEKKFVAERRPISLVCDIHPWMKGWIMVFDHPFFAVTKSDGSFEISGVPAGDQKLVIWQESVGYATPGLAMGMSVKVEAGKTTDVGEVKLDPAKVRK